MDASPEHRPAPADPTQHIVHVEHTDWQPLAGNLHERMLAGDSDDTLGALLLEHLADHPFVAMRDPDGVPPSRMFHALAWLVQQGHRLEERHRVEQSEFQRRVDHRGTLRRQWRLAPSAPTPAPLPIQAALF
jgi:hypothetical protein